MQIAVRRWFQLEPMQIAVPLRCYVGLTTALTAAALPPLTANCNHKRWLAQARAAGGQQRYGEQHLRGWSLP
jgi:hypothetical protein